MDGLFTDTCDAVELPEAPLAYLLLIGVFDGCTIIINYVQVVHFLGAANAWQKKE